MSVRVELELPEDAFSALRATPEQFVRELRLAAAVKWYETERLSQSKAAEVAGSERGSPEVQTILDDSRISLQAGESGIIHVRDVRYLFMFDGDQDPSSGTLRLKVVANLRYIHKDKPYEIEDWSGGGGPHTDTIHVVDIDRTTGVITLRAPLPDPHSYPEASSALLMSITGLSGDPAFSEDAGGEELFLGTLTHELGHSLASWDDIAPTDNVMHGYRRSGRDKLRFRSLPLFEEEGAGDEAQWSHLPRN